MTVPQANNQQISFFYEILRKGTHMGALVFPAVYYFSGFSKMEMLYIMIPLTILVVIIDVCRIKNLKIWSEFLWKYLIKMVRPHESNGDFTGATYILNSFCLTIALYTKPIAIAAIAFIIVGDTFAALIGRKFGRFKFYKNKTVAGSLGCLAGVLIVAFLAPGLPLAVAVGGAVAATIFEAFSFGIDDNVTVPILSGLVMTLLEKIFLYINFY